jgi:SAM-dependent methyltransferase
MVPVMKGGVTRLVVLLVLAGAIFFWWKKQIDQRNSYFDAADGEEISETGNYAEPSVSVVAKAPPAYEFVTAAADGIGKRFMGREIAKVMGHPAIGWLEREEREREEAPSKALLALQLRPTDVIADIGAGSGYYAFRMTDLVPQGSVVALDIQQEMLDFVTDQAAKKGVKNLRTHLGKIDDVALPQASIDAALMVDAYHEFSHPAEMLRSLHHALKPDGRIYLLEFRGEDPRVPIKPLHKMTEAQAVAEFSALGFRLLSNRSHLPWQHFMVFGKAE